MDKYMPLYTFLQNSRNDREVLTFQELQEILRNPLPDSAFLHRTWWGNEIDGRHPQSRSWLEAGWEVENVELNVEFIVTFSRRHHEN